MNKTHLRLVSLVTLICFMSTGNAWGAPGTGILAGSTGREMPTFLQIDIPQDLASIEEIYEAPAKADPALVLHIQNLHGNYEAQSQIKKLLDYLYKTYAFKLIFVEGAAEKLNEEYLRLFSDDKQNDELAEYLTEKGQLTGPEYYLVAGPKDVEAIGIERPDLYRKNLESFRRVYSAKKQIDERLAEYDSKIDKMASMVFTQEARGMIAEWRKFESGHRDFLPYVKRLSQEAKKVLGLDLESLFAQVEWPQVTRLLVIQSMEADLNRKAAEEERARLAEFLNQIQVDSEIITAVKKLGERRISMSRFDANGKENRLENLPRYLLERLVAEAGPKGFYFHDYPAFSLYAGYLILQSELQSQALYDEINLLFEKILAEQTPSEKEKNLLELFRDMELLKKLLHLELTRKEWKRASYRKEWINPPALERRLQDISTSLSTRPSGMEEDKVAEKQLMETFFNTALDFYDYARNREGAFYETIDREMKKSRAEKAVLVTGGFHTEGLMDLFREHGVNYGVLLPKILGSVADPENKYSEAMMESGSTLFDLATIEINGILQNAATYGIQGGNNWERVKTVLDGFLNKGIYESAEEAFKALNFASQGVFAKDQGFEFVPLPSKQVLFRITGDALIKKVREENHFDVGEEGYLQSRDGKYLIFEIRQVKHGKTGATKYRVSIPRFQNEGEEVNKPIPQKMDSSNQKTLGQTPPSDNFVPVPSEKEAARSELRSSEVDKNIKLESIRQRVLTLFRIGLDNKESSFGIHGTSVEAIEELLRTGRLPAEGRHPNEFYFYPKDGEEYNVELASEYAGWNAKKYYLAKKLPFEMSTDLYEELAGFVSYPFMSNEEYPNLIKEMTRYGITGKMLRDWLLEVEKQKRKGVVITVSSEIQNYQIFTPKSSPEERYVKIPGGLPLNLITGIEPIGDYEYDHLESLAGNIRPSTILARSELRQDTFNEFFSQHLLPELLSDSVASVRVYYQVEENKDYLMIEKHSDDGKVEGTVKVAVEKEKLLEIFYHLRRRFSIDRGIQPAMDPATIGLPGRGYTFVKWVDGEAEGSAVKNAFVSDQTTDEDPMGLAEAILNKINGTQAKYFKINAVALPARPLVAGFEMVEFTKEKYPDESAYLEDRRSYMVWKHIEQSMDLKSVLKDFAENKILALKRNAVIAPDHQEMMQSFLIDQMISEGQFDNLVVIDEHLFKEFLKLFLESSLGFLDHPQHYFPPLVPAQADLDIEQRERLLYENSLGLIKFAIEHSKVEEALIVGILLSVMKRFQGGQPAGATAQKFFKAVFDELGSESTDSEKLRSWNAKIKIYNFSKLFDSWTDRVNRSEVRTSAHVDNVVEVVAAAKKIFEEGYVPKNTTSLLDIGAGRGLMTLLAVERGIENIAAVDINRENLNKLETRVSEQRGKSNYQGNVRTLGMDMFDLDVKNELGERALFEVATIANVIGLSLKNVRYDADVELKGEADKDIKIREIEKREEVFKAKLIEMLKRVYDHLEPGGRVVVLDRTLDLSGILEGFSIVQKNLMRHATDAADNWQKQKDFFKPLLTESGFVNVNIHFGSVEEEDMDPYGDLEETVAVNTNFIVTAEKGIGSPAAWAKRSEARMTPEGEFFSDAATFWESMDKEEKRVESGTVRNIAGAEFDLIFEFHPGFNYENGANGSRFKQKLTDSNKGIWNLGIFDSEKKMIGFSAGKFGVDGANSISDVETFLAKAYRGQGLMTSVHEKIGEWLPEAIVWESGIGNSETIIDLARRLYKVNSNKGLETLISNPTTFNIREIQRILLAALESQEASLIFTRDFLKTTLVGNLLTKAGFEPMRLEVKEREYPVSAKQILIIAERPPRSEFRKDTRVRVEFPVQMPGDEMFRLGVRGDIPGEVDPKVKVGLNSGGFASTLETFEGIVKVLRNRASVTAASPFDEVVKDLGAQSGIPGIENFLDEPGLVGILDSDVPSDEGLRALAGLLLIFPRLSFHIIVRSESASLAPEQTELIRSIKAAKGRDGEVIGKRLIVSVAKRPQAVKQILDRWASRQANETANKPSTGKEKISAADIQSNLVALGIESMFEDLNLVSAKQVHGVEDEKRLARFDIQSLVSAMLSRNSAALLKEMPEVIQLEDPEQNVFTIIRSGINSISKNLTDAFAKAYKIATSA